MQPPSELEIDEGLDVAALHLYDYEYHHSHEQSLPPQRRVGHGILHAGAQPHRHIVEEIAHKDEGKHLPVARNHLSEHFGMEGGKHLCEHCH